MLIQTVDIEAYFCHREILCISTIYSTTHITNQNYFIFCWPCIL